MMHVAVLDDYQDVVAKLGDWKSLDDVAGVRIFRDHLHDHDAIVDRLKDYDCVVAMRERTPFPRALLARLPKLQLLTTTGGANASIDLVAAAELGIQVCATRTVPYPTSELTWGLVLSLVRRIPQESNGMRQGIWQIGVGSGLAGKTLGIIGLGRIGSVVAGFGRAFQMEVIAWSQNLTSENARDAGATRVEKDELLARSDVISIHTNLSERTRGLLGPREFALMKPTAFLVNTSRGPIIQEQALIDALRNRQIEGAALDVFEPEPLAMDHPYRSLDNLLLTPHIGYVTEETYRVYFNDTIENIRAWGEGKVLRPLNTPDAARLRRRH